jgi:uncharacterized membrane protein YciS (DUF1049 family)
MTKPVTASPSGAAPTPREHGAWGLLLQPFVAAAILAGFWHWLLLPTLALVLLGFLLKEPLMVLARQRWVWRSPNPQTPVALRWLVAELVAIAICLVVLAAHTPILPLAVLSAVALALTLTAVWFTVKNRQRSVFLQLLSAAGLSTSALLVVLVAQQALPIWVWVLCGMLTLHAATSILVVHTRLQRIAARRNAAQGIPIPPASHARSAVLAATAQLVAAAAAWVSGHPALSLPFAFSAAANALELYRLNRPNTLDEPLKKVGYRALATSLVHMTLTVATLWGMAHP